jgi:hypothetical protein
MHLHFRIIVVFAALIASVSFAEDRNAPTADELVSKNIEAKGGADALHALLASELPALNESLKAKGRQPIPVPPANVVVSQATPAAGGAMNPSAIAEAAGASILPTDFRLLH